ncbi:coenzyme PQQ synthesis protein D (PqqD) [Ruminococcus sp. CAG:382]|nr:coenzyme PQQ synthesis protein D (PqqD) [Ruminococcus sp. CAG:382]
MKLKDTFVSHVTNGEQILVDVSSSFSGLIRSNKTAAFIVDQLKSETTLDSIVDAMFEKYDAPKEVLRRDAQAVIDKLRSVGAIDEQHNI